MTMIDTSHLELPVQEVVPGSPEDPFSAKNNVVSSDQVAASPAAPAEEGTKVESAAEGPKSPSEPNATATTSASAPETQRTLAQMLEEDTEAKELIAGLIKEKTGEALRTQQSGYDKRINSLQEELKAAREAASKAEREAKLNSEDLTDEEKDTLRNKYALEDKESALKEYETELDSMYKSLVVAKLVDSHGQFGVTEEALSALDDPDEMEAFAKDKELDAYRTGNLPAKAAAVPDRTVQSPAAVQKEPEPEVPAGAMAPTDVGGSAPATPPAQLQTGAGVDVLASNLNKLQWETVRFN